jgi:hypothetical protein
MNVTEATGPTVYRTLTVELLLVTWHAVRRTATAQNLAAINRGQSGQLR